MDEKEASVTTEASGLTDDQAGLESASRETADSQLETTLEAPLTIAVPGVHLGRMSRASALMVVD